MRKKGRQMPRLTLIIPVSDRDLAKFTGELITWGRHGKCLVSHPHLHPFPIVLQPECAHPVAHDEISPEIFFPLRQIGCLFHISFHLFLCLCFSDIVSLDFHHTDDMMVTVYSRLWRHLDSHKVRELLNWRVLHHLPYLEFRTCLNGSV